MRAALAEDRLFKTAREAESRAARNVALALSCALHFGCVALLMPPHLQKSPAPQAIDVELVSSEDVAPPGHAPAAIPEEPASAAATPQEAAPPPVQAQTARQEPEIEKKAEAPDAGAVAPQTQGRVEQSEASTPPAAPSVAAVIDSEAEAAARLEKARAYASAVSAEINRRRIYPAAARKRGIVGVAKVAFSIDASGSVARFVILVSTGHTILDDAVGRIMQAMRTPPPPEGAFEATVTIRFGLR